MFAHRSCVIPFTKITMFPYPEQVQDIEHYDASTGDDLDVNERIQANHMVLMKSWTIKQYGAGIGDDFDAKIN